MKLFNLIWVLALAVAGLACDNWTDQPVVTGCNPGFIINSDGRCERGSIGGSGGSAGTGGSGGSAGSAGTGGTGVGACTNAEDDAVYADLVFTNDDGDTTTGSDAASAIASDCVFGSGLSDPTLRGCADLAGEVVVCAISNTCTPAQVQALSDCVESCMQNAIMEVTGSMLTAECGACYSASVSCSAELCATSGCSNPTSSDCVQCRCDNDCTPGFDRCSGLAPSGACD